MGALVVLGHAWYLNDNEGYLARGKESDQVHPLLIGRHCPVMPLVQVADLVEDQTQIEIEATSVVPD